MKTVWTMLLCLSLLLLAGCGEGPAGGSFPVQVVLEQCEGVAADRYVTKPNEHGQAVFTFRTENGFAVTGANWPEYTLQPNAAGAGATLTLEGVRYSTVVSLMVSKSDVVFSCYANGGERLDGGDPAEPVPVAVTPSHLRLNTPDGRKLFQRAGYTLYGWNTEPDGSGTPVGLGSRAAVPEGLNLYAQWSRWTPEACFTWESFGEGVRIAGYQGREETITIPEKLGGKPVRSIAASAFAGAECKTVILPPGLSEIQSDAFQDAALETLYLFDDIVSLSGHAFDGCEHLTTLYLNAAVPPVYSGTYFDTFSDKFDRLLALQDQRKIVLFSGSSTRFGYDSAALDRAFPAYEVVNMGVFAYTNALPQLLLILPCMGEGDLLLHSPEFDAAKRQFCTTTALDAPFFALMESNYDMIARLDLQELTGVFSALNEYLAGRRDLSGRSYDLSPADFDEDGNPVSTKSYNKYGDYILYRPNGDSEAPVYGLPEDYTVAAFPESYLRSINTVYGWFQEKGLSVLFTYAPRNQYAISERSTLEARTDLDTYLREKLAVPVLGTLEESLVPGTLLYGTDNHLSTEGAALRTEQIISEIKELGI